MFITQMTRYIYSTVVYTFEPVCIDKIRIGYHILYMIYSIYKLFLGNGKNQKPVKMTDIRKSKIQVLMKPGYYLSVAKLSDLNSDVFSPRLEC